MATDKQISTIPKFFWNNITKSYIPKIIKFIGELPLIIPKHP